MQFFTVNNNLVISRKKGRIKYCAELIVNYVIEAYFTDKLRLKGIKCSIKGKALKESRKSR